MHVPWTHAGSHAAQFYEDESYLHRAIATFFGAGTHHDDALVMASRRRTFDAVVETLHQLGCQQAAERIMFLDADAALDASLDGARVNVEHAATALQQLVSQARPRNGNVRMFGELVEVLCERGRRAAASCVQEVGRTLTGAHARLSMLCGYPVARFEEGPNAMPLRALCRRHTHALPAEGVERLRDGRAILEEAEPAGARAFNRRLARPQDDAASTRCGTPTICVIDDESSVRKSLARLLAVSTDWNVRTFDSAERFLAERDDTSNACLLVDMQLLGMSGLDLQGLMADARSPWPIVAMSGSTSDQLERQSFELGARAFLRKPFAAQALLDSVELALA